MNRLTSFLINLRASLWLIPSLMLLGAIGLALGLIELDTRLGEAWLADYPRLFGLGAEGSRGMLSAIAGSMLTVAALAFTLTLNTMAQASSQFTPRIFRNFMRDRANQFVLGYFVSVFAYCLLVLRTVRGVEEMKFVPSLAVSAGLLLALGGIIVLIFFIHHIADSLQITTILARMASETRHAIEQMFPQKLGRPARPHEHTQAWQAAEDQPWFNVPALKSGYVQTVDTDGLLRAAEDAQLVVRMERGIGQFVGRGAPLLSLTPATPGANIGFVLDDHKIAELNHLFGIDRHRTIEQDAGFGIRQIVDVALKALSPGVNDTTTAITCIDTLSDILGEIARRQWPAPVRVGRSGARVIVVAPDFHDYVRTAFDQIRVSGRGNFAVLQRLVEAISFVAQCTGDAERRAILEQQLALTVVVAERTLETDYEMERFRETLTGAGIATPEDGHERHEHRQPTGNPNAWR